MSEEQKHNPHWHGTPVLKRKLLPTKGRNEDGMLPTAVTQQATVIPLTIPASAVFPIDIDNEVAAENTLFVQQETLASTHPSLIRSRDNFEHSPPSSSAPNAVSEQIQETKQAEAVPKIKRQRKVNDLSNREKHEILAKHIRSLIKERNVIENENSDGDEIEDQYNMEDYDSDNDPDGEKYKRDFDEEGVWREKRDPSLLQRKKAIDQDLRLSAPMWYFSRDETGEYRDSNQRTLYANDEHTHARLRMILHNRQVDSHYEAPTLSEEPTDELAQQSFDHANQIIERHQQQQKQTKKSTKTVVKNKKNK